ncbi:MAG: carboxypeptidase-like regulatory domain-containing protein [Saprospiraceae bacterium]
MSGNFSNKRTVTDKSGNPLSEMIVMLKGHNIKTVTDENGHFEFNGFFP